MKTLWQILWGGPHAGKLLNNFMATVWMLGVVMLGVFWHSAFTGTTIFILSAVAGLRWGWAWLGEPKTRGDYLRETLHIWDQVVRQHPELHDEYDVAHEWLTRTWTVEELTEAPK